jgi:hypothetical protein
MTERRAVICMPSSRDMPSECADSFAGVYGRGLTDGTVTAKIVLGDTYIDTARNLLVTYAIDVETNPTHIFWMDDDMIVPSDAVARLLAHDKPIVGGLYHQRAAPFKPVAYMRDENSERGVQMITLPDNPSGLVQVDGLGLGATLVDIRIYKDMVGAFSDVWWHQVSTGRGEDIHFFARCAEMGVDVFLDCDLRCGHVRREAVGTLHYSSYRKAHPDP